MLHTTVARTPVRCAPTASASGRTQLAGRDAIVYKVQGHVDELALPRLSNLWFQAAGNGAAHDWARAAAAFDPSADPAAAALSKLAVVSARVGALLWGSWPKLARLADLPRPVHGPSLRAAMFVHDGRLLRPGEAFSMHHLPGQNAGPYPKRCGSPCLACGKCGAWAQSRPRKLAEPCPGPAHRRVGGKWRAVF